MIDALKNYTDRERAGILATIALATSPNPSATQKPLNPDEEAVLQAIRETVPKSAGKSVSTDEAILKVLTDTVLRDVNVDDLLKSAGTAGRLPPSLYTVVIPPTFMANFSPFHVRESDVTSTVNFAEDVQHLEVGDDNSGTSLFVRLIENKNGRDPFWAVGHFHRNGVELIAHNFWRIYFSEIDVTKAKEPVDLVEALVAKVGSDITINGRTGRFFHDYELPADAENYELSVPSNPRTIGTLTGAGIVSGKPPFIILAYGIGVDLYRDYLARHGVPMGKFSFPRR